VARNEARWRVSALALAACVSALLGGGVGRAFPEEPPADVVADLERQVGPRSDAACPDAGVYSLARPDPAAGPTVVGLGIFFQDVASLSDVDQTLDADVLVVTRWRDRRLADPKRGEASVECPVPDGRLWIPSLEPENLRGRQAFYPTRFLVDGRGVVTYARSLWVKLSYPLDFRDFPRDRHHWQITLWPVLARADEVVFHPLRRVTGMNERLSIQGWRVGEPRALAAVALAQGPHAQVFDRLNRWGRWVFPLAMLANFALAFLA
jgi:hypothetical protein